jgi:hypothetical protein
VGVDAAQQRHPVGGAGAAGRLRPAVISWGLDKGFKAEFDMLGTRDPSAHLSAPAAIALMREWGLEAIQAYNHALAWPGRSGWRSGGRHGFDVPEAMIASMATVPLPDGGRQHAAEAQALRDALFFEDGIEVQMHAYRGRVWARISAQIYNDINDIDRLAEAVVDARGARHRAVNLFRSVPYYGYDTTRPDRPLVALALAGAAAPAWPSATRARHRGPSSIERGRS